MDNVIELNQILDEEIKFCEEFENLLWQKRDILVHSQTVQLKEIDTKIYSAQDKLNKIKNTRITALAKFDTKYTTLTDVINMLKNKSDIRILESKRTNLKNAIQKIVVANDVVKSLIEHSLSMIDGTISTIATSMAASRTKGDYYNKYGTKAEQHLETLSAIVEDA